MGLAHHRRHRAMGQTGGDDADMGALQQCHHPVGRIVGGDVDILDRPFQHRIAHAAADKTHLGAVGGKCFDHRLGFRRLHPGLRRQLADGFAAVIGRSHDDPKTSDRLTRIPAVAPPDHPLVPGHRPERAVAALDHPAVQLVVFRVEQEVQRHLEHLGHLERIGVGFHRRHDHPDHRGDDETGAGDVIVEPAQDGDAVAGQTDLFLGFAQGGDHRIAVVSRFQPPTGKADLAGMMGQMRRALGQQHGHAIGVFDQRHQHGGRGQRPFRQGGAARHVVAVDQAFQHGIAAPRRIEAGGQTRAQPVVGHSSRPRGKKVPLLHNPYIFSPLTISS